MRNGGQPLPLLHLTPVLHKRSHLLWGGQAGVRNRLKGDAKLEYFTVQKVPCSNHLSNYLTVEKEIKQKESGNFLIHKLRPCVLPGVKWLVKLMDPCGSASSFNLFAAEYIIFVDAI